MQELKPYQESFVRNLIEWDVVKFGEFKLKSGRPSPYFVNMATAMDSGQRLLETGASYAESAWPATEFTVAHGPAMKGIPLVPAIAASLLERGKHVKFAFDFKEGPVQVSRDPPIGVKLRVQEPTVRIVDSIDTGLMTQRECNSVSAQMLAEDLHTRLTRNYSLDDIDCVVGKAYGGIVPAALLVREIAKREGVDLRFAYDRVSTKQHGVTSEADLVGRIQPNDRVLVVDGRLEKIGGVYGHIGVDDSIRTFDDVITTGKAKRESKHKVDKTHPRARWDGVHVGVYRGEVDEEGRTVDDSLREHGLDPLRYIVSAEDVFRYAHNKEFGGHVRVDDKAMEVFRAHLAKYGPK